MDFASVAGRFDLTVPAERLVLSDLFEEKGDDRSASRLRRTTLPVRLVGSRIEWGDPGRLPAVLVSEWFGDCLDRGADTDELVEGVLKLFAHGERSREFTATKDPGADFHETLSCANVRSPSVPDRWETPVYEFWMVRAFPDRVELTEFEKIGSLSGSPVATWRKFRRKDPTFWRMKHGRKHPRRPDDPFRTMIDVVIRDNERRAE